MESFVLLSLVLLSTGLYAMLARNNLIAILIGVELMLNAASLNFMAFNYFTAPDPVVGQVVVLFIIGLAAAEAAIALSIILVVYRQRKKIDVDDLTELEG
ncbi:MAG: NADH-quinone oxidoreductase subunit NuoK [Proteobacteria bacterium]|nr:MAG: NADH-quinone oxidoreductase subunit NuoK [Pseudomonadota bacterium]